MVKVLNAEPDLHNIRQFGIFDDFTGGYLAANDRTWTDVASDTGASIAIDPDGIGGIVTMTAGTADNGEAILHSTNEIYKFQSNKPLTAVARFKITQGGTNQAAVLFGLMDAAGTSPIQDNGDGPKATYHGAVFFKNEASADLQVESTSTASTAQTTTTTEVDPGTDYESYMIVVEPVSDTDKRVTFWHDDESTTSPTSMQTPGAQNWKQLKDTNGNLIKHTISLATPAAATGEMQLVVAIKNSSAAGTQTIDLDYLGCWQLR
jgi:hypothetical protein